MFEQLLRLAAGFTSTKRSCYRLSPAHAFQNCLIINRVRSTLTKVQSIQFLRGIASISVVVFHCSSLSGVSMHVAFLAAGVDIFFVISGIVMALSISDKTKGIDFLYRRFLRVVPMYWIFTALAVLFSALQYGIVPPFSYIFTSLFFLPPAMGTMPILYPGWSLNFEMFFYLILSVFIITRTPVLYSAVLIAALASIGPISGLSSLDYYLSSHLIEFSSGIVIGLFIKNGFVDLSKKLSITLVFIGFFSLILQPQPSSTIGLSWGIPSIFIVVGMLHYNESRLINTPLSRLMGDASYSIYLAHPFVIWIYGVAFGENLPIQHILIASILSIIAGLVSFWVLERPINGAIKKVTARTSSLPAAA